MTFLKGKTLTVIIYREEHVITTDDGWRDYDRTAPARMEIVWDNNLAELKAIAEARIDSFVYEYIKENTNWPEMTVLCNGIPLCDIDEGYEDMQALAEYLAEYAQMVEKEMKRTAAQKANDERLARERIKKAADEKRERTMYENLKSKFEVTNAKS